MPDFCPSSQNRFSTIPVARLRGGNPICSSISPVLLRPGRRSVNLLIFFRIRSAQEIGCRLTRLLDHLELFFSSLLIVDGSIPRWQRGSVPASGKLTREGRPERGDFSCRLYADTVRQIRTSPYFSVLKNVRMFDGIAIFRLYYSCNSVLPLTHNQRVGGSSPSGPTKFHTIILSCGIFCHRLSSRTPKKFQGYQVVMRSAA